MFFVLSLALSGLTLIFLEFFLPGAILAIGGAVLLLASLFFFHMAEEGLSSFLIYLAGLCVALFLVVRIALWRVQEVKKGWDSSPTQEEMLAALYSKELIGKEGVTTSALKPEGKVLIEGAFFSALCKEEWIEKGKPIEVIDGQKERLIVRSKEVL